MRAWPGTTYVIQEYYDFSKIQFRDFLSFIKKNCTIVGMDATTNYVST